MGLREVVEFQKHYPFAEFEKKINEKWDEGVALKEKEEQALKGDVTGRAETFTLMMPPPNVTGRLHLGHTLSSTLQDIVVRYQRMRGKRVKWLPGLDHAGIATQMMVEKLLLEKGMVRQELGRETFLEHVWAWKKQYGSAIVDQMKRLGFSASWKDLQFTMDPHLCHAVTTAFVELYNRGLVYRDVRLINWDPGLQTALSDLEVFNREEKGTLFTIRYPLVKPLGGMHYIDIATTRPETLFGDTAVAVHPEDERYTKLIGARVRVPLSHHEVGVIADVAVEPEKGTGALKVTPAHDMVDFEIGKRHALEFRDIFDEKACLNGSVPERFRGLERYEARKAVVEELRELGALIGEEAIVHALPVSDRSGCVIEPRLMKQWFVDTRQMAKRSIQAVATGKTRMLPETWEKEFFGWLENIQPWCVSRQLWWGHQLPVWYGPEDSVFVAMDEQQAHAQARETFGTACVLTRDEDVLDTWFSSGLWPFATLGWPEDNPQREQRYPGDLLVTGHDILFFWVARMMMLGLELVNDIPFRSVFLHPLIRDAEGKKMSKTKGNVIDPLDLIDSHGADALRLAMAMIAAPTRYVRFGLKNVEQGRNFITKLWNAGRLCAMGGVDLMSVVAIDELTMAPNIWIFSELKMLTENVESLLESYRFHEAAQLLYQFTRRTFCDWYLEFMKEWLRPSSEDSDSSDSSESSDSCMHDQALCAEARKTLGWAFGQLLSLLHPFIPYVTEALWQLMGGKGMLMFSPFPTFMGDSWGEEIEEALSSMQWLISVIGEVRSFQATFRISKPLSLFFYDIPKSKIPLLETYEGFLKKFLKTEKIVWNVHPIEAHLTLTRLPLQEGFVAIPLDGLIDPEQERRRLAQAIRKQNDEIVQAEQRLQTLSYCDKAPSDVVEELQDRLEEARKTLEKLQGTLDRLH